MTGRASTTHSGPEYLLPATEQTVPIRVRCSCGPVLQTIPLHMTIAAIVFYRAAQAPADLIVQSWRCPACKDTVKITAAMLYLAA